MKIAALKTFCLSLPGTTQDVKWGADVCFSVVGKMYAVTGMDGGAVSLKVPEPVFAGLVTREGITPAPYLARHHWVLVAEGAVSDAELRGLLTGSHGLVLARHGPRGRKARAAAKAPARKPPAKKKASARAKR